MHARAMTALVAVSLALLLQCLAPPGYMAGSLDNGWPVVLCPEGLPTGFLGDHHHHHEEGTGEDVSLGGYCPLGGILDVSTALPTLNLAIDPIRFAASGVPQHAAPSRRRVEAHPARAPPTRV